MPSLWNTDYEVPKSCFKIDLSTGELVKKSDMLDAKMNFGLCNIGQFIYTIGGIDSNYDVFQTAARYNLFSDEWKSLPKACTPDGHCMDYKTIAVKKRYIFVFSGVNKQGHPPNDDTEKIMLLDTLKLEKGYKEIVLKNACAANGFAYGIINLGFNDEDHDNF